MKLHQTDGSNLSSIASKTYQRYFEQNCGSCVDWTLHQMVQSVFFLMLCQVTNHSDTNIQSSALVGCLPIGLSSKVFATSRNVVSISEKLSTCEPIDTLRDFFTYFKSASEHPFCHGASGVLNSQSKVFSIV